MECDKRRLGILNQNMLGNSSLGVGEGAFLMLESVLPCGIDDLKRTQGTVPLHELDSILDVQSKPACKRLLLMLAKEDIPRGLLVQ